MIDLRRPRIKLVTQRIIPGPGRGSIKAGNACARWKIIRAPRQGVGAETVQALRHTPFNGKLHRLVIGVDVLKVLLDGAEQGTVGGRATEEGFGNSGGDCIQSERSTYRGTSDWPRIQVQGLGQMAAVRGDISSAEQNIGWQLAFDCQVPVVQGGRLIFVSRVPAQYERAHAKVEVRTRWVSEWKGIGSGL